MILHGALLADLALLPRRGAGMGIGDELNYFFLAVVILAFQDGIVLGLFNQRFFLF